MLESAKIRLENKQLCPFLKKDAFFFHLEKSLKPNWTFQISVEKWKDSSYHYLPGAADFIFFNILRWV